MLQQTQQNPSPDTFGRLLAFAKSRIVREGFNETGIDGLWAVCRTRSGEARVFLDRFASIILQGRKSKSVRGHTVEYGAGDLVVNCIDMPTDSTIEAASPEVPFISLLLDLDKGLLAEMTLGGPQPAQVEGGEEVRTLLVEACSEALAENFLRLAGLAGRPAEAAMLAPIVKREIHARLLLGAMGPSIRSVHAWGTRANQISQAVTHIREHFRDNISMQELAERVNMSAASFNRHFRKLTGCSPLRYQKELRLHEARRAMGQGGRNVSTVAYAVGYASASQFAVDYKSFFGISPKDDAKGRAQAPA